MRYVVNLTVVTKSTDVYDRVAINKYPIWIESSSDEELMEMLNGEDMQNFVVNNVSEKLFNTAVYYIRDENGRSWTVDANVTEYKTQDP